MEGQTEKKKTVKNVCEGLFCLFVCLICLLRPGPRISNLQDVRLKAAWGHEINKKNYTTWQHVLIFTVNKKTKTKNKRLIFLFYFLVKFLQAVENPLYEEI